MQSALPTDDGINIATNGNVTLTNVEAEDNGTDGTGMGIYISVGWTAAGYSGTVTMTNIDTADNYGDGLHVEAWKNITLKDFYAEYNYNGGRGAFLATDGGVSVLNPGGTAWNDINYSSGSNLVIDAVGDVIVQKMRAYGSSNGYGVQINTPGKVTLTSLEAQSNTLHGLQVTAGGSITASGLLVQYNDQSGAELTNNLGGSRRGDRQIQHFR